MTVAELIEKLGEFPPDWEVRVPDNSSFDNPVETVERGHDREAVGADGKKRWRYFESNSVHITGKYLS